MDLGIGSKASNIVGQPEQMDTEVLKKLLELMASVGGAQGGSGAGNAGGGSGGDPQAQAQGPQIQMPEQSQGSVSFG
ncbi:hypothetical protein NUV89_22685 [Pseudomonas sp. 18.1.10]|uniref:hypothetical protein n=1 Tax=Pseudomonas sp. 18.1.10 TaxID=2969302 RepID=UPI00214F9F88|nr:hypothetical protein [Pseudomonas sp. 18.1.10]MCR4541203.1 hypothetical protein [Pseudomonas sp. 18.1.10]